MKTNRKLNYLIGKNIVVYDLEIKTPIDECPRKWVDYKTMEISVGVMFDYRELRYRMFMDDNIQELTDRLNEPGTLIVAFNQIDFDNKLLRTFTKLKPDDELNCYDMLHVSRTGAVGKPRAFVKGFKLDEHLKALDMPMKTGDGAMAPIWWREKKYGKVCDYCLNDVKVEKSLFEHIWKHGVMKSGYSNDYYDVKVPNI